MARNYTHINGAQRVGLEVTEKEPTVNLSVSNWLRKKNENCWESIGEEWNGKVWKVRSDCPESAEGNSGMKPTKETSTSIFLYSPSWGKNGTKPIAQNAGTSKGNKPIYPTENIYGSNPFTEIFHWKKKAQRYSTTP